MFEHENIVTGNTVAIPQASVLSPLPSSVYTYYLHDLFHFLALNITCMLTTPELLYLVLTPLPTLGVFMYLPSQYLHSEVY